VPSGLALGLGAALIAVFAFIAAGRGGSPSVIAVGMDLMAIAISPDGANAYVVTYDGTVIAVSLATSTPGKPIPIMGAASIAIAPDGATAYVTNSSGSNGENGTVTRISLATGTPGKPIPAGDDPQAIAINSEGTAAYVVNMNGDNVTVFRPEH